MDFVLWVLGSSFAFVFFLLATWDFFDYEVPTLLAIIFLFLGAAISFYEGAFSRAFLAAFFFVFVVALRRFKPTSKFIGLGDAFLLAGLSLALPYREFMFAGSFAALLAILGGVNAHFKKAEWKDYMTPLAPLLLAGVVLAFFLR